MVNFTCCGNPANRFSEKTRNVVKQILKRAIGTQALSPQSLTCERLDGELRLLGVHLILNHRVNMGQNELDAAHRGAQLPESVCAGLLTLRKSGIHFML